MSARPAISEVCNEDNMAGMARFSDGFFDLAVVDPPYGIKEDGKSNHSRNKPFGSRSFGEKNTRKTIVHAQKYAPKQWDKEPPPPAFFAELRRVSKNQIIWGANHFISRLPYDSPCWIVWDKDNSGDFADCELAWTSFPSAVRMFEFRWNGMLQGDMANKEKRIHPTQKPVALYKWLLQNYAKPGDKILDTHLGSQSSRIAAWDMGFDFTGFELDPDYFAEGNARFKAHQAKPQLFAPEQQYQFRQGEIF
jgi:site-specific DNA-methyltransferase (adenine-specific)